VFTVDDGARGSKNKLGNKCSITYPMIKSKSCYATVPHFNLDARGKNHGSLEDSSPKRGDIPEKSTVQIIRHYSSIVIMKDKSNPQNINIIKKSLPPLG